MSRYQTAYDGDWIWPAQPAYKLRCCDCGLTHMVRFRIYEGHIEFSLARHNRATASSRRMKNYTCKPRRKS